MRGTSIQRNRRSIRESNGDRLFMSGVYIVLITILLVVLYPLIYIVSVFFQRSSGCFVRTGMALARNFTLLGYKAVLSNPQILSGYGNSLFYALFGTLISVTLTVVFAYPLSRKSFFGRNFLMVFITFTMLFSGGLIPSYLVVKELGMLDTRWALLIPGAIGVWQVIVARTFLQSNIPDELAEASEIDGCSDLRFMWSIVIPLSKPIIAVLCLMYAVGQWNAYFDALIYLKSQNLYPLQLVLRSILILGNSPSSNIDVTELLRRQSLADLMKYSLIVVASLPVLIIYPFIQRHFTQGMLIGSVKG